MKSNQERTVRSGYLSSRCCVFLVSRSSRTRESIRLLSISSPSGESALATPERLQTLRSAGSTVFSQPSHRWRGGCCRPRCDSVGLGKPELPRRAGESSRVAMDVFSQQDQFGEQARGTDFFHSARNEVNAVLVPTSVRPVVLTLDYSCSQYTRRHLLTIEPALPSPLNNPLAPTTSSNTPKHNTLFPLDLVLHQCSD